MDYPSNYYFTEATEADGPGMLEILENPDFQGDLSIIYTRRPNPVISFHSEGDEVIVMVGKLKATDEIIGFGCCTINNHFFNGRFERVCYLSGLRIKTKYRKHPRLLVDAYKALMFKVKERGIDLLYTTVLDDNVAVKKMFEKKRKVFPYYLPISHYTVHAGTVRMAPYKGGDYLVAKAKIQDIDNLVKFLKEVGRRRDFYPEITKQALMGQTNLQLDYRQYYIAKSPNDETIKAAVYLWHHQLTKQHILYKYNGIYRLLKHLGPVLPYIGYPKLPREGTELDYYSLSFYGYEKGEIKGLEALIRTAANDHKHCHYYIVGTTTGSEENQLMTGLSKVTYTSQVYMVDNQKTKESQERVDKVKNTFIECGLL